MLNAFLLTKPPERPVRRRRAVHRRSPDLRRRLLLGPRCPVAALAPVVAGHPIGDHRAILAADDREAAALLVHREAMQRVALAGHAADARVAWGLTEGEPRPALRSLDYFPRRRRVKMSKKPALTFVLVFMSKLRV